MKAKLFGLIILITIAVIAAVIFFFALPSEDIRALSLSADVYFLNFNEVTDKAASAYVNNEDAKKVSTALSGEYRKVKEMEDLSKISKDYHIGVTPIKMKTDASISDSQPLEPYPSDDSRIIYVFDKKTIGFFDGDEKLIWIGKKVDGVIDIDLLAGLIEANEEEPLSEEGQKEDSSSKKVEEGVPGMGAGNMEPEDDGE